MQWKISKGGSLMIDDGLGGSVHLLDLVYLDNTRAVVKEDGTRRDYTRKRVKGSSSASKDSPQQ